MVFAKIFIISRKFIDMSHRLGWGKATVLLLLIIGLVAIIQSSFDDLLARAAEQKND